MADQAASSNEVKFQYSEQELTILREIENAGHLREMVYSRGWELFIELKNTRIKQIENQVLRAKLDKDALWAAQIRCQGITEFMNALLEGIDTAVETLEPGVLERLLKVTIVNPSELDGDLGMKDI